MKKNSFFVFSLIAIAIIVLSYSLLGDYLRNEEKAQEEEFFSEKSAQTAAFLNSLNENSTIAEFNQAIGICFNYTSVTEEIHHGGLFKGDQCFLLVVTSLAKKDIKEALEICENEDVFFKIDARKKCFLGTASAAIQKNISSAIEVCELGEIANVKEACLSQILQETFLQSRDLLKVASVFEDVLSACEYGLLNDGLVGEQCILDISSTAATLGLPEKAKKGCDMLSLKYIGSAYSDRFNFSYFSPRDTSRAGCFKKIGQIDNLTSSFIIDNCELDNTGLDHCYAFGLKTLIDKNDTHSAFELCEKFDRYYIGKSVCLNRIAQFAFEIYDDHSVAKKACSLIDSDELKTSCFRNHCCLKNRCSNCGPNQLKLLDRNIFVSNCDLLDDVNTEYNCLVHPNIGILIDAPLINSFFQFINGSPEAYSDLHNVTPVISCSKLGWDSSQEFDFLAYFANSLAAKNIVFEQIEVAEEGDNRHRPFGKSLVLFPKNSSVSLRVRITPEDIEKIFATSSMCEMNAGDNARIYCELGVSTNEGNTARAGLLLNLTITEFDKAGFCG